MTIIIVANSTDLQVVPCIMSSTEQEARHIGMFLKETWTTLASWANSSKTYAAECNKTG